MPSVVDLSSSSSWYRFTSNLQAYRRLMQTCYVPSNEYNSIYHSEFELPFCLTQFILFQDTLKNLQPYFTIQNYRS